MLDRQPDMFGGDGFEVTARRDAILSRRWDEPPFTVLDTRTGPWQARKREWLSLGIQSELGRGENTLGLSAECEAYRQGSGDYAKTFNSGGLETLRAGFAERAAASGGAGPRPHGNTAGRDTRPGRAGGQYAGGDAWLGAPRPSIPGPARAIHDHEWQAKNLGRVQAPSKFNGGLADGLVAHREAQKNGQPSEYQGSEATGTSIFDPRLCELMYKWFVPAGGHVLDPFCGGSVRGIVASCLGYAYTGIDLRPEQVDANEAQANEICPDDNPPAWIAGDSREVLPKFTLQFDGILTCPPYADLERYSDDPRDISTMAPAEFEAAYCEIMGLAAGLLAPDRFACVVIGNVRDKRGHYRDLVGLTHRAMAAAGCHLYNQAVLINAAGSLPVRVGAQFKVGRKLGKSHQDILVYIKGDWRKAAAACNGGATEETV